ncbi:integral membrane protein [Histoplasma capsulatum G186AR]|uniref:Integral membrane protein n=2 Tax=Ajellomyces capsulatus TaxID=5037 RepID=C0NU14_AJECG|nr:uncharacterized protein HCBG_06644 [Histoplasma capsulatum G186AR]EEH05525.1 integral membrane protein [Histoplasma capsulatum G186AR]KAG5305099.1 integral membrane protein [Histoplasma capsulatum]QSS76059.1 integral membrane protein [Histoplasma capsulatum G186AR]
MDDLGPPPDGDVNKGPMLNAITWTECGVALALVLARIITRTRLIQRWGWDDAFMCLAMVCALVNTVCVTICIHYGTGRHVYYLNDYQKVQANKYNWISQGFHVMSTNWGKVSIAFFLLRIVDRAKRQRYIFFVGMVVLTIVNSVCVYTIYGQCTPTTALWNGVGPGKKGSCWHPNIQRDYAFFQGSFSAASDLVLALYPVFIIWQLQMARNIKIGLTCVLALGVVATAAAVVKTIFLAELVARSDYTFETINLTTWISTEQYLIIIAACIPTLGPLFTATTGRTPSGRRAGSSPGYKPSGSHSRRYFQQGHSSAGASGFGYKKRAGSDMLTYTMDEFTTTTTTNDGWTRTSPPNGRKSDEGSEDAIIKGMPETDVVDFRQRDRAGSNERTQSSRGILKTMEVQVNSQNLGRNTPRRPPANKKVLLPWEPTSPA